MGYGGIKNKNILRNSYFLYLCGVIKQIIMAEQIIGRLLEKNIL